MLSAASQLVFGFEGRAVLFSVMSVFYRPVEQLLSRTIASRRALGHDPGFALANPKDSGIRRMPMVQVALDRYRRDQERNKKD